MWTVESKLFSLFFGSDRSGPKCQDLVYESICDIMLKVYMYGSVGSKRVFGVEFKGKLVFLIYLNTLYTFI